VPTLRRQQVTVPDKPRPRINIKTTVPDKARDKARAAAVDSDDPAFQPTKQTIPLEPSVELKNELDSLRKEFKERLRKTRAERGRKDSD
jgi:hypothetical protein